jgi:ribosomal protein L11 methylase PrmA
MSKARSKSRASKENVWALKRRVSPVMGEIILEVLYKSQGRKLPATEIASTRGILLEQISPNSTNEKGWKKTRLPAVNISKNQAFQKPIDISHLWRIVPSLPAARGQHPPRPLKKGNSTESERIKITIEAGAGFGSGQHETTQLCLLLLENIPKKSSFLDVGTGSGILALGAFKRGFLKVVGLDCDENALRNARYNARLNRVKSIRWKYADVSKWKNPFPFQVIAANLLSSILIQEARRLASWLQANGFLIVSGFFTKDVSEMVKTFSKHGLTPVKKVSQGRWCALLLKKE